MLVATDLSETAAVGLRWAVEIAADHHASLHLLHALSLSGWAMDYVELQAGVRARMEEAAREQLRELALEPTRMGLQVTWEVAVGAASELITEAATKRGSELLVIGTRGLRGLDYLLLGSTAQRVVQRAPCPVLTVHPHDAERQRPVRRVLAAIDFSPEATAALSASLDVLGGPRSQTELCLLHAYHVPYELGLDNGYVSAAAGLQQWKEIEADVLRRLESLVTPYRDRGVRLRTLAVEGYPPEVIVEQAAELAADLVAMGTHGRTGLAHVLLGSTAERVIHKAPCPVLTVRRDLESRAGEAAR